MSTIKIRRSSGTGAPITGTLGHGEVAYSFLANNGSNGGDILYIGTTDDAASLSVPIGGKYYTDLLGATAGQLPASQAIITNADSRVNQIKIGDTTNHLQFIATTGETAALNLTISAGGLNFSGGNLVSDGSATITGLPTPTNDSDVATKGYVTTVASGLNVAGGGNTSGTVDGGQTFTFAGSQGVTTSFDDGTDTLTIGLQQVLDTDADVAFGSVTVGETSDRIKISNDTVEQVQPQIYLQFDGSDTNVVNLTTNTFTINNHGLSDNDVVTYTHAGTGVAFDGLNTGTPYYVVNSDANTFKLSTTLGGSIHDIHSEATGGGTLDVIKTDSNPVNLFATTDSITIGSSANSTVAIQDNLTVGGNTVITGDLTVNGTSTTVNSTVVQVDDPILEVGTQAVSYDGLGRGIKFNYNEGGNKEGFFGYDVKNAVDDSADGAGKFRFLTDASNVDANNLTGTVGTIVANVEGDVTGNADTATAFSSGRAITITGAVESGADAGSGFVAGAVTWDGSGALTIDTRLTSSVGSLLGSYVENVTIPGTYDGSDAFTAVTGGSAIVVDSINSQTSGNRISVDVNTATTRANATGITKAELGVASFSATSFSVTDGWVDLNIVDGGSYGTG
jgi:hypothetical protein